MSLDVVVGRASSSLRRMRLRVPFGLEQAQIVDAEGQPAQRMLTDDSKGAC